MFELIVATLMIGFLVYPTYRLIKYISKQQRLKAEAWLAISRAQTSTDIYDLELILSKYDKQLNRHIRQAIIDRKTDLEVEQEKNGLIKEYNRRKSNAIKCN